jgi:hypothetical protein
MSVRTRIKGKSLVVISDDGSHTNFNEEVAPRKDEIKAEEALPASAVPPRYFVGIDLKKDLPDYEDRRRGIKHNEFQCHWESRIASLLAVYDPSGDQYHIALVKSIMTIVERYLIYSKKLGPVKKQIVMSVCGQFFDKNEKLLSAIIEREMGTLIQSTMFSRLLARLEVIFFSK